MQLRSVRDLSQRSRADFAVTVNDLAFLEYAAAEWGHHASSVPAGKITDLALPLLRNSFSLFAIARVRDFSTSDFRNWKQKTWAWATSGGAGISLAAQHGLTELLELLITEHQDELLLDARNIYGNTALHESALFGHETAAQVLLDHGASLLDTNYSQSTPLYFAVSYGHLSMVRLLLQHGREQLDCAGPKGLTVLHKAVEQGDAEMVATLLQAGAMVGATDNQGSTPLHVAAYRGHLDIVKSLVLAGAFIHVKDKELLCPLDYAATAGFVEIVAYLLEHGGSMFHKGRELWTPLHRAARGGTRAPSFSSSSMDPMFWPRTLEGTFPYILPSDPGRWMLQRQCSSTALR